MHVAVEGGEEIVPGGAGVEAAEALSVPFIEGPVPFQGQAGAVHVLPPDLFRVPYLPEDMAPFAVIELGAVGEEGNVVHSGIEAVCDLFRHGGHRKGAGAVAGDKKFVRIREEVPAGLHGGEEILPAVEVEDFLLRCVAAQARIIRKRFIDDLSVSQVHVSRGIGDDKKIPVVEGIDGFQSGGDPVVDVHDLGEGAEVFPVIVGQPGRGPASGDGSCRRIGIPGDAAS